MGNGSWINIRSISTHLQLRVSLLKSHSVMDTPSAADLPCIGDLPCKPQTVSGIQSDEQSIDLALLAALRHKRQQRKEAGIPSDEGENSDVATPVNEEDNGEDSLTYDKSDSGNHDKDESILNDKSIDCDEGNEENNEEEDIGCHLKANFKESVERVKNAEDVRPAIVISGTSVYIRLEKRDFLKVRSSSPFFWAGTETVTPTADSEAEPFYRIKAVKEQGTVGFDTRNPSKMWVPIPLCLHGGRILTGRLTPFVFLASKSTTCKVVQTESRCYPTIGAVKFEVENFGPAERFFSTVIEDCQGTAPAQSPSVTVPPSFFAVAMQTILNNPNNRMNQLGGGTVVLQAPANTIRLRLDYEDSLSVNGVEVVAWTQGVRFTFTKTWFFARKLIAIKGPGTVWISADMSVTITQNPVKISYVMRELTISSYLKLNLKMNK